MKMHAVYVLQKDPDLVVFDLDLMDPQAECWGRFDEFEAFGLLPLKLKLNPESGHYEIVELGDQWVTMVDGPLPPGGQDCCIEIATRREQGVEGETLGPVS